MDGPITCPFCGVGSTEAIAIQLHIEEHHTDNSPFVVKESDDPIDKDKYIDHHRSSTADAEWTKCTRSGCGEYVHISGMNEHLAIHAAGSSSDITTAQPGIQPLLPARQVAFNKSNSEKSSSSVDRSTRREHQSLLDYFSGNSYHGKRPSKRFHEPAKPGRLGKRELGPHAFEKAMPAEVQRRLFGGAVAHATNRIGSNGRLLQEIVVDNQTDGLVSIIADLCALDPEVQSAYLCHANVKHVHKIPCDGNFCGYWNIQMLLSHLRPGQQLPNVLQLQETIEQAWSDDICAYGKIETGGIRGTRKWIGTSEALAYFTYENFHVDALSFRDEDEGSDELAVASMLDFVEAYFMSSLDRAKHHQNSHTTELAPIYLQRLGHSMTIVGLERKTDGSRNLLVYDPSLGTSEGMKRLLAGRRLNAAPETLLKPYRKSDHMLARWHEFEVIVPQSSAVNG